MQTFFRLLATLALFVFVSCATTATGNVHFDTLPVFPTNDNKSGRHSGRR